MSHNPFRPKAGACQKCSMFQARGLEACWHLLAGMGNTGVPPMTSFMADS